MGNKLGSQSLGSIGDYVAVAYKLTKDTIKVTDGSIVAYVIVIFVITLLRRLLPGFVLPIAAILFFSAPYLMKSKVTGLKWNLRGVLLGVAVSVIILSIYVVIIKVIVNKPLELSRVSYALLILQLFLVALPEEVFFRGYLQEKIGNNLRGILIVSSLFAIGHFATVCLGGGYVGIACLKTLLTFFPSIVMGFMYAKTGTIWGNVIFHFLANVVYEGTGGL
ncbi:MAG: CPBP family glutamic-type intramembrane protease [Thermodesulfobacteriota bacterium]